MPALAEIPSEEWESGSPPVQPERAKPPMEQWELQNQSLWDDYATEVTGEWLQAIIKASRSDNRGNYGAVNADQITERKIRALVGRMVADKGPHYRDESAEAFTGNPGEKDCESEKCSPSEGEEGIKRVSVFVGNISTRNPEDQKTDAHESCKNCRESNQIQDTEQPPVAARIAHRNGEIALKYGIGAGKHAKRTVDPGDSLAARLGVNPASILNPTPETTQAANAAAKHLEGVLGSGITEPGDYNKGLRNFVSYTVDSAHQESSPMVISEGVSHITTWSPEAVIEAAYGPMVEALGAQLRTAEGQTQPNSSPQNGWDSHARMLELGLDRMGLKPGELRDRVQLLYLQRNGINPEDTEAADAAIKKATQKAAHLATRLATEEATFDRLVGAEEIESLRVLDHLTEKSAS